MATPDALLLEEARDYERLFGEPGWHRVMRALEAQAAEIEATALTSVKDMSDVWRKRGQVEILRGVLATEAQFLAQKARLLEPADDGAQPYEE